GPASSTAGSPWAVSVVRARDHGGPFSQATGHESGGIVVAPVHQWPAPAGSSIRDHDNRFLRARASAPSVLTVGFGALPVSSFESVARSIPDRSETSERLTPWRSRSARSAASALANSGSIARGGNSWRTLRITSASSAWPSGVARLGTDRAIAAS